jgi:hypothetical protein
VGIEAQLKSSPTLLSRANWRLIAYWTFTLFVAYENLSGSIWAFLRIEYVRVLLTHLGYPLYFLNILGPFELACAVALLVPRFPVVVKEWAYTGAFINYSGALASHLSVGDGPGIWILPVIMVVLNFASWGLRPPDRRTNSANWAVETRPMKWLVPIVLLAAFAVLGFLTLPGAGALQR